MAAFQIERAGAAAQGRRIETEAAPIRYVAAMLGVNDDERAIRCLILAMTLRVIRRRRPRQRQSQSGPPRMMCVEIRIAMDRHRLRFKTAWQAERNRSRADPLRSRAAGADTDSRAQSGG